VFHFSPTGAAIVLIGCIFEPVSTASVIFAVAVITVWSAVAYIWAYRWFEKYIIMKIGGGGT